MADEMNFYAQHFSQQYKLLGHEGQWSQCHCHDTGTGKVVSRELIYGQEKVKAWVKANNGKGNVFIGRSPRDKDGNVIACTALSLDLDPVRAKGTAATDQQHRIALRAAQYLSGRMPGAVIFSSGNGALVLFPLRRPISSERAERVGKEIENQARLYLESFKESINVDSTWDAARLVKVAGTISTKGNRAHWRYARLVGAFSNITGRGFKPCDEWINNMESEIRNEVNTGTLPRVGDELDRSKADFVLATRLKLQGFTLEEATRALKTYGLKEGREDRYYQQTVSKAYAAPVSAMVGGRAGGEAIRPVELWTPDNGLQGYTNRAVHKEPELPTGYAQIDRATHGLERGHIFTVGARTNNGKTTFSIGVAHNLCKLGKRVLFISTETQYHEVWDRYIAHATGVSAFKLQHGLVNGDGPQVQKFVERFKQHPFTVYDGSRPSLSVVRQAVEQATPDILVYDYFQHSEGRETRELEEFVMQIKELAKEKQIAVLMCAQLHDGPVNPKTQKLYPPTLGSMKNCKVLNDESRVVILLDWDRDGAQGDGAAAVKVILAKNKGPKTDCVLKLNRAIPRFEEDKEMSV